ncbi:MAG TPA: HEAT repeat domain-containing protein [Bryobacteraceae bacterium]|nr:HEAT repeat domain-containing protein [Bryobacteraceae bacterium]
MRRLHPILVWAAAGLLLASLAQAQPRIGTLDFFGLHKVPEAKIRQALGVHEGDPLPPSKGDVEERLNKIPGVVESHLEAVCCENGKTILYVGIEESGAPHFDLRDAPEGNAKVPDEIASAYLNFLSAFEEAAHHASDGGGSTEEDLTKGYARMADPAVRAIQDMFPALAAKHMPELREVLHNSGDEEQRAMAAYVIGYAPDQKTAVNDLQYALRDADAGVRANAARGLVALAVHARLDPSSGIKVEPTWFIEMLNSLSWSDRTRALAALQILTDNRDPSILEELRSRALPALIEMARWKTLVHALPAYILLGRIAGLPEKQIEAGWARGDRESVIAAAQKTPAGKKFP